MNINKKLKVMIVDDEYLVRNLIRNCINWNQFDMNIICEASNAKEALPLVDKLVPDIIFTDIYMPVMDGIEFSEEVLRKHQHIKIIIITGYDKFEYALRSIKAGVNDFLLKPINDDEIKRTVVKIKKQIEEELKNKGEFSNIKDKLEESIPSLRQAFLNELIIKKIKSDLIKEKANDLKIKFGKNEFQIAIFQLVYEDESFVEKQTMTFSGNVLEMIESNLKNDIYLQYFFDRNDRFVMLNSGTELDFDKICEKTKNILQSYNHCLVNVGIGNVKNDISDIYLSYKEACDALKYITVIGNNTIIKYGDTYPILEESHSKTEDKIDIYPKINYCIKDGNRTEAYDLVQRAFQQINTKSNIQRSMKILGTNIVATILNILIQQKINIKEIFKNESEPYEKILEIQTFPQMKSYLFETIDKAIKILYGENNSKAANLSTKIKIYMRDNLSNTELSLKNIAAHFFINPSYLSRIFKKQTGCTLTEHLLKLRIEEAIELLTKSEMKVYEIAQCVGIEDSNYFSICFKKYTGISVTEYKKLIDKTSSEHML